MWQSSPSATSALLSVRQFWPTLSRIPPSFTSKQTSYKKNEKPFIFQMVMQGFSKSMRELFPAGPPRRVAVALSGGVDSMALLHLLNRFNTSNIEIHAITIDHRLRTESAQEAQRVKSFIKHTPVKHTILPVLRDINLNQMERHARDLRYDLLNEYCKSNGIKHLFLAHHNDDQLETMGMRLLKHSSFFGLRGMKSLSSHSDNEVINVRPLLRIPKSEVYQYARDNGIQWVEDPSNYNPNLTLRNNLRSHISQDVELKSNLRVLNQNINEFVNEVESSMVTAKNEMTITPFEHLGCLEIKIPRYVIEHYHEIVLNRILFEAVKSISPDRQYEYKFRKFDSHNTGLIDNGFSLISELLKNPSIQLVHCLIRAKIREDGQLDLLVTRQKEETKNGTVKSKIKLNEWIEFDNRFKFKFTNQLLEGLKIVNYNYKLHYNSIKNKGINKTCNFYQLPVVTNEENEIQLFPTLGGCEMGVKNTL